MLQSIINKILVNFPQGMAGIDRHDLLGKKLSSLREDEIKVLRNQVKKYLLYMLKSNASDIEIGGTTAKDSIWFRVYGKKTPHPELGKINPDMSDILCHSLLSEVQRETLFIHRALDFSYSIQTENSQLRWRATMYLDLDHLALNMRTISEKIYPYQKLELHPNISKSLSLAHEKQGLILVTGITGSGKSTTMDSIIDANNRTAEGHIVIIGDPIEQVHHSKKCIIRHREVGRDVLTYKEGAIQSLRQDPDIIVVGEMRNPDTIMTCLEITDTGHKVFSTLHTCSAVETIDRIVAECPTEEQERVRNRLADVLRVIISQKLVPTCDGKLTLAKEVLLVTSSVKAAIRNKNTQEIYQMISENGQLGMITLEQDLVRLCKNKTITEHNAYDYANNKNRINELFSHSGRN